MLLRLRQRHLAAARADQVGGHQVRALVQQLEVGVLAVQAQSAPDDGAGIVVHYPARRVHALAARLHVLLLQVGRQPGQRRRVGRDQLRRRAQEIAVPDAAQCHRHRQVLR
jgi:hypothetical protein